MDIEDKIKRVIVIIGVLIIIIMIVFAIWGVTISEIEDFNMKVFGAALLSLLLCFVFFLFVDGF